jgi:hypothetical protein
MKRKHKNIATHITAESLGIEPAKYQEAIRYLFDRPLPSETGTEWYWDINEPDFEASPVEWIKILTLLYSQSGDALAQFDNERVGMGLNYLMSSGISMVSFKVIDQTVQLSDAMLMMESFKTLWRSCIGPRLMHVHAPIGSCSAGMLGYVCYIWFDESPIFWNIKEIPAWRDAHWSVLEDMLSNPCREVKISALHGIGHDKRYMLRDAEIDERIEQFIRQIDPEDEELKNYARAAKAGMVQ